MGIAVELSALAEDEETIHNCFPMGKFCASGRYSINSYDTSCNNNKQKKSTSNPMKLVQS